MKNFDFTNIPLPILSEDEKTPKVDPSEILPSGGEINHFSEDSKINYYIKTQYNNGRVTFAFDYGNVNALGGLLNILQRPNLPLEDAIDDIRYIAVYEESGIDKWSAHYRSQFSDYVGIDIVKDNNVLYILQFFDLDNLSNNEEYRERLNDISNRLLNEIDMTSRDYDAIVKQIKTFSEIIIVDVNEVSQDDIQR